jgi:hypothetical protein
VEAQIKNKKSLYFETITAQNIKIPEQSVKLQKQYLAHQNQNKNYPLSA